MTNVKTLCASSALLLASSTFALAQTVTPQTITPPPSGSHPEMLAPQDGADNGAAYGSPYWSSTAVPSPQMVAPGQQVAVVVPGPQVTSLDIQSAVRKRVENAGYDSVYGITPSLDGYHARALMSGQRVTVDVDGYGNVQPMSNQHQ